MFDFRASLIPLAAPAGVLVAASLWLAFGGHSQADEDIARLQARISAASPAARPVRSAPAGSFSAALAAPVFALTTGPGAVTEVPLTLTGISVAGARRSALVSISGKPAAWLDLGATRDGVTVMAVSGAGVTVDTPTGFKTIGLSNGAGPSVAGAK